MIHETTHTIERIQTGSTDELPRLVNANTSWLDQVVGNGWLATGDAAIALDPLSGNGIIRAMRTGIEAAEYVLTGGSKQAMDRYEDFIQSIARENLVHHQSAYGRETRWQDQEFWQRRLNRQPNADVERSHFRLLNN